MDTIQLPVRPYVLKFLQFYLGATYVLTEADQFGAYLYTMMRRPTRDGRLDHVMESYTGRWEVDLTSSVCPKKNGLRLTGKVVHKFNKFVDEILRHEMCGYVDQAVRYGNKIKYAIEEFVQERNITEEELPYETLYKHYQRTNAERRASKKKVSLLRPGRSEAEVRKDLLRTPLPAPPAREAA